jgi:hypothetical protein
MFERCHLVKSLKGPHPNEANISPGHDKMQTKENLWYRVGYALETVRKHLPESSGGESTDLADPSEITPDGSQKVLNTLLTAGAGSIAARLLSSWPSRRPPGLFRLFRAGAAGAAAAFLAELVRPVLTGRKADSALEEELTDVLLAGVGRGLLYAALVEPRIPGGPILQGAVYGGLEYALTPWGGLRELAGSKAPFGGVPALSILLKDRGTDEELVERIAYGVALALLYRH